MENLGYCIFLGIAIICIIATVVDEFITYRQSVKAYNNCKLGEKWIWHCPNFSRDPFNKPEEFQLTIIGKQDNWVRYQFDDESYGTSSWREFYKYCTKNTMV